MNPQTSRTLAIILLTAVALAQAAYGQGTAFNYTGYLLDGTNPANGSNDLQFTLYTTNTSGSALGTNTLTNQPVNNGIFVVTLDFGGGAFNGSPRWLEIAARPGGSANPFTNTFPRQPITAAPYAVYANNGVPVGSVMAYMGTNPPAGWLLCDGTSVSRATFAALFAVIGTSSGTNDATTFKLPDLRGMFLRGVNGSRADAYADPDANSRLAAGAGGNTNNVGSVQGQATRKNGMGLTDPGHSHTAFGANGGGLNLPVMGTGAGNAAFNSAAILSAATGVALTQGDNETRPKNAYVNYIIKY